MKKLIITIALFVTADVFPYDPAPPSELFTYMTAVHPPRPDSGLSDPALLSAQNGMFAGVSYSRPYSINELESCWSKAGWANGSFSADIGWTRFGIKEYYEDTYSLGGGAVLNNAVSVGATGIAKKISVQTDVISSSYYMCDSGVSVHFVPIRFLHFGFRQNNLYSIFNSNNRDILFPETSFGTGIVPMKGVFCSWNYTRTYFGGVNTWSCEVSLLREFSVSAGYSRETATYAAGVSIAARDMIFSYTMSYHAYLGFTHRAGVSVSTGSFSFTPIDSSVERISADDAGDLCVDLAVCSVDELKEVKGLSEIHAQRLIRFREIMGPITEKACRQMGLTSEEIAKLKKQSTGFAPEEKSQWNKDESAHDKKFKPFKKSEIKKALFIRLVEGGISPAKALLISDIAMSKPMSATVAAIDSMKELSPEEKRKAKTICGQ